jgi:hypothetical protein
VKLLLKLALLAVGVGVVTHESADSMMNLQVLPALLLSAVEVEAPNLIAPPPKHICLCQHFLAFRVEQMNTNTGCLVPTRRCY